MIIGIHGKPGGGKDTIGKYLIDGSKFFHGEIKVPILDIVRATFPLIPELWLIDRKLREQPLEHYPNLTVRKITQDIGLSFREMFGYDIWPKNLWHRMLIEDPGLSNNWVITDVRTPEDISYIKEQSEKANIPFISIKVERPGHGATTEGGYKNHKLESYELDYDYLLKNDGTIEELYCKVDEIKESSGFVESTPESSEMRSIIGICGDIWEEPGVGKTTAVDALVEMGYHPISLLDPVKDVVMKSHEFDDADHPDVRYLLDEALVKGKEINEDYWLNLALANIPKDAMNVVIDDVFFENEVERIRSLGGRCLWIDREGEDSSHWNHLSKKWGITRVENKGSIEDLKAEVELHVTMTNLVKADLAARARNPSGKIK
jgi:hypothetical protein